MLKKNLFLFGALIIVLSIISNQKCYSEEIHFLGDVSTISNNEYVTIVSDLVTSLADDYNLISISNYRNTHETIALLGKITNDLTRTVTITTYHADTGGLQSSFVLSPDETKYFFDQIYAIGDDWGVSATFNYYLPLFKPDPDYWSGLGITNLSSTSGANILVTVYDQNGATLTTETKILPIRGQDAFLVGTSLGSDGWIKISSDQALAGLNFLGEYEGASTDCYLADVPFTETLSTSLLIPHVAQNTTWDTTVFLANPNTSTASVNLTYTDKNGVASTPYTTTVPANGSKEITVSTIAGSNSVKGGSVTISSTQGLTAFALYNNLKTGDYSYAGINAVDISE